MSSEEGTTRRLKKIDFLKSVGSNPDRKIEDIGPELGIARTGAYLAYGQPDHLNSNVTNSLNIQNIPVKKVHVGDIDIAYKTFGKGGPILLISGASSDMNAWEPSTLRNLSSNHTVIVFDNRGVGNTTTGTRPFSFQQLANDTAGLLDALKTQKPMFLDILWVHL